MNAVKRSTEVLTLHAKDAPVSAAPSKPLSKTKYKGWWPEVEDMFEKGLMMKVLSDRETRRPCVDGLYELYPLPDGKRER